MQHWTVLLARECLAPPAVPQGSDAVAHSHHPTGLGSATSGAPLACAAFASWAKRAHRFDNVL